jgi:GDSL-like Lipase/Acylhydrolase family
VSRIVGTAARARWLVVTTVLVVGGLAGCSGSSTRATLPPEQPAKATIYVALGGDDNVGGRATLADAWPQRLFRAALPRAGVFVNFADSRAGAAEILSHQVDDAARLQPDIVTVTLVDDAERDTDPSRVEQDLTGVIERLGRDRHTRILVGTIPAGVGTPEQAAALDQAIATAAAGRATVVDLGAVDLRDRSTAPAKLARAFAAALR